MGKRADDRARTRQALAEAAVELFLHRPYPDVTMADIAEAAGVSRRTAYRHCSNKDELVVHHPTTWLTVFDHAARDRADEPVGKRLRLAARAVVAHIEADPEPVRRAFAAIERHPELASAYMADNARWIDRVAAEIERDREKEREDSPIAEDVLRAGMLAAAVMGMIDRVCRVWAETDRPMGPLVELGFDLLEPALSDAERH